MSPRPPVAMPAAVPLNILPPPAPRPRTPTTPTSSQDVEMQTATGATKPSDETITVGGILRSMKKDDNQNSHLSLKKEDNQNSRAASPLPPSGGKLSERRRDAKEVLKMANASLHKCRGVRKAVVHILQATPEQRYQDLLKGFLANLEKIVAFLEKRRPVSSPVAEAQVIKCRSWVAMVIVPFYQKMEANPAGFRSLLQPNRTAARKDMIRRISIASNTALKRAMHKQTSAAWDSSPRLEPVSNPAGQSPRPASSSNAFTL